MYGPKMQMKRKEFDLSLYDEKKHSLQFIGRHKRCILQAMLESFEILFTVVSTCL